MTTSELTRREVASIRALMSAAFVGDEAFADTDWDHTLGGIHYFLEQDGPVTSHASVVERVLWVDDQPLRTGYVEAVATDPHLQGRGLGTRVMSEASAHIRENFQLGALGTGRHGFYRRLGWEPWAGPTFVRAPEGLRRTPDEDGYILILRTSTTPPLDMTASLVCDWREGDVW